VARPDASVCRTFTLRLGRGHLDAGAGGEEGRHRPDAGRLRVQGERVLGVIPHAPMPACMTALDGWVRGNGSQVSREQAHIKLRGSHFKLVNVGRRAILVNNCLVESGHVRALTSRMHNTPPPLQQ
jgi:hypothetical protein